MIIVLIMVFITSLLAFIVGLIIVSIIYELVFLINSCDGKSPFHIPNMPISLE